MSTHAKLAFFLGANTQDGFCSRFDELRNLPNYRHQYIIKGSPGSGKSTFMRRVAQAAEANGYDCEYIFCSSDADSLDGVIIHDLGVSFADGTAPHVVEPRYAGASESYIDFSPFWNEAGLESAKGEIAAIDASIKSCYRNAYGHLRCAGIYDGLISAYGQKKRDDDLNRRLRGLIKREIPKGSRTSGITGRKHVRYLSGFTPTGQVTYFDTLRSMCDRVIGFADDFGTAQDALAQISDAAQQAGFDVYSCLSPLYASEKPEHLIIPALRLGFATMPKGEVRITPDKRINLNAYVQDCLTEQELQYVKTLQRRKADAIDAGLRQIAMAKAHHDALETVYGPHMDFSRVGVFTDEWLKKLGLV